MLLLFLTLRNVGSEIEEKLLKQFLDAFTFITDEFPILIYKNFFTDEVYKYKISEHTRDEEIVTYSVDCRNAKIGERHTKEGANELISIHRDIFDITPYKQDIDKIKGIPNKFNKIQHKLLRELEHFQLLPTIPYSCKIIKESTPTLFSRERRYQAAKS